MARVRVEKMKNPAANVEQQLMQSYDFNHVQAKITGPV